MSHASKSHWITSWFLKWTIEEMLFSLDVFGIDPQLYNQGCVLRARFKVVLEGYRRCPDSHDLSEWQSDQKCLYGQVSPAIRRKSLLLQGYHIYSGNFNWTWSLWQQKYLEFSVIFLVMTCTEPSPNVFKTQFPTSNATFLVKCHPMYGIPGVNLTGPYGHLLFILTVTTPVNNRILFRPLP